MAKRRGAPQPDKGGGKNIKARQDEKKPQSGGPLKFAREVRGELRKVTWPGRDQLQQSTAVVLIIVLVLAAFVSAVDFLFQNVARIVFL